MIGFTKLICGFPKLADTMMAQNPFFRKRSGKTFGWQRKKLRCMILHDHEIIWAKIRCCNACTKRQQSVRHPRFPPFHFDLQKDVGLISVNRCGMVGVGLGALRKGEMNLVAKKNSFSRSVYNWVRADFGDQKRDAMSTILSWNFLISLQDFRYSTF